MNPVLNKYHCRDAADFEAVITWKGRKFKCILSGVSGRGSAHSYDVDIINISFASIHLAGSEWVFISNKGQSEEVALQLGKEIEKYWEHVDRGKNNLHVVK